MITNSMGMKLVLIPKGTFMMGSPIGEDCGNEGQHQVTISNDYYLGATPVTVAQYEKVTGRRGYFGLETESGMSESDRLIYPVACIPWEYAVNFARNSPICPRKRKKVVSIAYRQKRNRSMGVALVVRQPIASERQQSR